MKRARTAKVYFDKKNPKSWPITFNLKSQRQIFKCLVTITSHYMLINMQILGDNSRILK